MSRHRPIRLSAIILVTLLVQLATPGVALADGETPPSEPQPTVESPSDAVTVAEILEVAPAGTEVVVAGPAGEAQPLATQAAADLLPASDPEWCPDGSSPGDPLCTGSFGTVDALLDAIQVGGYSGNGTIYFTTDYAIDDAYFRGSDARLAELEALGIDGMGHTLTVPIEVTGWAHDVSILDLDIDLSYAGTGSALLVETTGAIQVTDVSIIESPGDGAVLNNTAGDGSIMVADSTFNDNTWTGLDVRSHGDVELTNVVASGQEDGATLDASGGSGSVEVTGSDFSGNTVAGLTAKSAEGGVLIDNVTASSNSAPEAYGIGARAAKGGSVTLANSTASLNGFKGVWIEGTGPVNLVNVTADGNVMHGAYVHNLGACSASAIDVTVDGGTFTNNGGYGLLAVLGPHGTLTFANPATFGGNELGDFKVSLKACPECKKETSKPYNFVYVPETGGPPVHLDCDAYSGTVLILPDGDRATLVCPVDGEATLDAVPETGLPGALPTPRTYLSGASVGLLADGQPVAVLADGGYLMVSFVIPEEMKDRSLAILYWDASTGAWVELPAYSTRPDGSPMVHRLHPDAAPDDLMYILGGVRVTGDVAKVKVTFGGTFALVAR